MDNGSTRELFDFMLRQLGGESAVRGEFLKNKIATLNTSQMTVGELLNEAENDGWNEWLKSLKFSELSRLLTGNEGPTSSVSTPARVGKRMTADERDKLHQNILDYLRVNPWSLASAIADHVGLPTRTIGLRLKDLREKNLVRTEGEKAKMTYSLL